MSQYEEIENQIAELKIKSYRLQKIQRTIGEFIFELYHRNGINDEKMKSEIALIIHNVESEDLNGLGRCL